MLEWQIILITVILLGVLHYLTMPKSMYIIDPSGEIIRYKICPFTGRTTRINKQQRTPKSRTSRIRCVEEALGISLPENFTIPDLLPEKEPYIETLDFSNTFSNLKDQIVGRIPGFDGRGVRKIKIKSAVDGRVYTVRDFADFNKAADTLAKLHSDANKLINYLRETDPSSDYTKRLIANYDGNLSEETPKNLENLTSYTIEKKEIVSCLRTKDNKNELHDYNLLLYVFIHELSHIANGKSFGHDGYFEDSFVYMLQAADKCGILKRMDFEKNPVNFCGLEITHNLAY